MIRILLAILVSGLLWQCQDIKYPEAPENLIDREKMISIYTDAYLANASKNFNRTILLREQVSLTDYIYKKYDIDSVQYEQSNAYYSVDLDEYRKMFQRVQANIDARLAVVDSLVEIEEEKKQRKKDSTREARKKRRDSLGITTPDSLDLDLDKELHDSDTMPNIPIKTIRGEITPRKSKDSLQ